MVKEVNGQKFTWGALWDVPPWNSSHIYGLPGGTLSPPSAKVYPVEDIFWLAFSSLAGRD